jgi:hypothetical protein
MQGKSYLLAAVVPVLFMAIAHIARGEVIIGSLPGVIEGDVAFTIDSGQTFSVPPAGNNYFSSFTVYVGGVDYPTEYVSQLYQFNPTTSEVVGSALYTSNPTIAPILTSSFVPTTFAPSTPIPLTPGGTYIFTFAQGGFGNEANLEWEFNFNYAGGEVFATHGTSPYFGATWLVTAPSYDPTLDFGFTATFVPEPASLSTACLVVIAAFRPRRREGVGA